MCCRCTVHPPMFILSVSHRVVSVVLYNTAERQPILPTPLSLLLVFSPFHKHTTEQTHADAQTQLNAMCPFFCAILWYQCKSPCAANEGSWIQIRGVWGGVRTEEGKYRGGKGCHLRSKSIRGYLWSELICVTDIWKQKYVFTQVIQFCTDNWQLLYWQLFVCIFYIHWEVHLSPVQHYI